MSEKKADEKILEAFDRADQGSVAEVCRLAGVSRVTFHTKLREDADFKRKVLLKKREVIDRQIAATA